LDVTVYDVALVPIIIALTQLAKAAGFPQKFSALLAAGLGVGAGFLYLAPGDPAQAVLKGLAVGLAAAGLYSSTKNTVQALK